MTAVVTPANLNPDQFDVGSTVAGLVSIRADSQVSLGSGPPVLAPNPGQSPFYVDTDAIPAALHVWGGTGWTSVGTPEASAGALLATLGFVTCSGAGHAQGAAVPTCTEMTAAIAASGAASTAAINLLASASVNDGDAAGGALSGTYPDPSLNAQVAASDLAGDSVAMATLLASLRDAADGVRGLVNNADMQVMGDGRKVFDVNVSIGNTFNHEANSLAVGNLAGANNTGNSVVLIGSQAGLNNTGFNAVHIGTNAGFSNTGGGNVSIGPSAGQTNAGGNVVCIGVLAGNSNTRDFAVCIGSSAGRDNTGLGATIVGANAGITNSGTRATIIGNDAGESNTGLNAVLVGNQAGGTNTGASCTFVGTQAGSANTFNNAGGFGAAAQPTADNEIMLGNFALTSVRSAATFFGAGFTTVSDARNKDNVAPLNIEAAIALQKKLAVTEFDLMTSWSAIERYKASIVAEIDRVKARIQRAEDDFAKQLAAYQASLSLEDPAAEQDSQLPVEPTPPDLSDLEQQLAELESAQEVERKVITHQAGVIAQDLRKLTESIGAFGWLVKEDALGELAVDYQSLAMILNAATAARLGAAGL